MEMVDRVEEWQRLQASYSSKTDEELQALADESYELTELAQQVLKSEIARRGLPFKLKELSKPPGFNPEPGEFDPSELELVVVRRVWDLTEARQVRGILDDAGIPSFLGQTISITWRHSPRTRASRMGSTQKCNMLTTNAHFMFFPSRCRQSHRTKANMSLCVRSAILARSSSRALTEKRTQTRLSRQNSIGSAMPAAIDGRMTGLRKRANRFDTMCSIVTNPLSFKTGWPL